jgi:hypothetical protein
MLAAKDTKIESYVSSLRRRLSSLQSASASVRTNTTLSGLNEAYRLLGEVRGMIFTTQCAFEWSEINRSDVPKIELAVLDIEKALAVFADDFQMVTK